MSITTTYQQTFLKMTETNKEPRVLHLTLTSKWFKMILDGIKPEEYREVKAYWSKRLLDGHGKAKEFDVIVFKNGYAKNCPMIAVEFKGLEYRTGNQEWGAQPGIKYYVLLLGEILAMENIKST